jgi:hypothetical protein
MGIATWIAQMLIAFAVIGAVFLLYVLMVGRYFDIHAIIVSNEAQRHVINMAQVLLSSDRLVYEEDLSNSLLAGLPQKRYYRAVFDRTKLDQALFGQNQGGGICCPTRDECFTYYGITENENCVQVCQDSYGTACVSEESCESDVCQVLCTPTPCESEVIQVGYSIKCHCAEPTCAGGSCGETAATDYQALCDALDIGYPGALMQIVVSDIPGERTWTLSCGRASILDRATSDTMKSLLTCMYNNIDWNILTWVFNVPKGPWQYWDIKSCSSTYASKTGTFDKDFPVLIKDGDSMHAGRLFLSITEV